MASNSKVVIFLMAACLSPALIRVEARMGETFLQRVQTAYTQANSEYYPVRNTKFTKHQKPEELKESDSIIRVQGWEQNKGKDLLYQTQVLKPDFVNPKKPVRNHLGYSTETDVQGAATNRFNAQSSKHGRRQAVLHHTSPTNMRQSTHAQGWELKKGTNPRYKPKVFINEELKPEDPITNQRYFLKDYDEQGALTKHFNAESNYYKHGTRQAAVHHTIPASERNSGKETTRSMDVAGYTRPDATTNERVQSTYVRQDATREEYMPQGLSREAMERHTMPESISQGTRWSHAKHTNPTFMPQSNHKWAQGKRTTITAMLNGMGEGGDK